MAKRGTLEHEKTFQLAQFIGIPECYALGVQEAFWQWCARYRPNGDLTGVSASFVARSIHYPGDGDQLFEFLIKARFIDKLPNGKLFIHDWPEHAENSVHQYLKSRGECFADGTPPFCRYKNRSAAENDDSQSVHESDVNSSQTVHESLASNSRQPLPLPLPCHSHSQDTLSATAVAANGSESSASPPKIEKMSAKPRTSQADCDAIAAVWNKRCREPMKPETTLEPETLRKLRAAIKRYDLTPDSMVVIVEKLIATPFCLGAGQYGWIATFDWLVTGDHIKRLKRGDYDGVDKAKPARVMREMPGFRELARRPS